MKPDLKFPLWSAALCALLAVALQVQVTLFKSVDYTGLRLNLADLALPVVGVLVLVALVRHKSAWPQWRISHMYFWLGALTLVLLAALGHGYLLHGELSQWALVNKILGWFVLMGYLGLGGWMATNLSETHLRFFVKLFVYAFSAVVSLHIVLLVFHYFNIPLFRPWSAYPISGFMANRNAYAFLAVCVIVLFASASFRHPGMFPQWFTYFFWLTLPFAIAYIGSRAGIAAVIVVLILLAFLHKKAVFKPYICILCGLAALVAFYVPNAKKLPLSQPKQYQFTQNIPQIMNSQNLDEVTPGMVHIGDSNRLKVIQDSKELVRERPLLGSGLGGMLFYQQQKRGEIVDIIDNTSLWLLVETGLIGLGLFVAFWGISIFRLWQNIPLTDFYGTLSQAAFLIMVGFAVMSLLHEILYTRHLWLMLGLALAMPAAAGPAFRQN